MEQSGNPSMMMLTGAGSSVHIGIPTMKGMVRKYRQDRSDRKTISQALTVLDQLSVSKDLEEMLLSIQQVSEYADTPLYRLFDTSVISKANLKTNEFKREFRKIRRKLEVLQRDILSWIATTCLRFDRGTARATWEYLSQSLISKAVPLYTTNYDFSVEEIAEGLEMQVVDNFRRGAFNRFFWDESLSSYDQDGLVVVKLHGSVNWYTTSDHKRIEKLNINAIQNREGLPVERVAIFPTRFKDIYETHFFSLYKMFIRAIDESKLIIVVGHSLRDEYIRAAIREGFRDPEFKMVYIGPTLPNLADFRISVSGRRSRVKHVQRKFEEFAGPLAYLIETSSPESFFEDCSSILRSLSKVPKLKFDKPATWMTAGKPEKRKLFVSAAAFPSARLETQVVDRTGTPVPGIDLMITDRVSGKPVEIFGVNDQAIDIEILVPDETPAQKTNMLLSLVAASGQVLVKKSYALNIRKTQKS